jgi:hypothetical protein
MMVHLYHLDGTLLILHHFQNIDYCQSATKQMIENNMGNSSRKTNDNRIKLVNQIYIACPPH